MNFAIFGGAFDPVHAAHLTVAFEARERFGLSRIVFVPSGNPPHKKLEAPFEDRVTMTRLAAEPAGFEVSDCERGGGPSYSYDTLRKFDGRPAFIIGTDAFADVTSWHRWPDVSAMTEFIVVARPGHSYDVPPGTTVHRLDTLALPVSSTEIRRQLVEGVRPEALPDAVYAYILERGLYSCAG